MMALTRIVSGGQTGVDRGALEAALDQAFPCGGWCPEGRMAEDGVIPERYPLEELAGGYEERTLRNVLDSDGTAILHAGALEGGTLHTKRRCQEYRKPCKVIDAELLAPEQAASELSNFVKSSKITILNVAGPRASKWPGGHAYAYQTITRLLRSLARIRSAS
jgi:Circularly permutated YpsA SLOG family